MKHQVAKRLVLLVSVALAVLSLLPNLYAKKPAWAEGKLVLAGSAMTDGYRTYKVTLVMGDQAAILWNRAGAFNLEAADLVGGDCDVCLVAQRTISTMLLDCGKTQADFCQHQMPISYHLDTCRGHTCLAIDFPLNPERGLAGRHKTMWVVAQILPAAEAAAETRERCLASQQHYVCRSTAIADSDR
jgi:hypothetical protein